MASSLAVQAISEELGVHIDKSIDLNDVAKDAESYVTSILELANRLRKHKTSKILRVNDLNDALASRLSRPLYGYKSNRVCEFKSVGVLDNVEILANTDREISLNEISSSSLKRYPIDTSFSFHWLAIKGVEPQIEENSCIAKVPGLIAPVANSIPDQTKFSDQNVVIIQSKLVVSKELQNFYFECLKTIQKQLGSPNSLTPEFISLLKSLSKEAAIQPLLKFFLKNITDTVSKNYRSISNLRVALSLAKALFSNPNLENELFLLTYMTTSMTILISRSILDDDPLGVSKPVQEIRSEMMKCHSIEQGISIRNSAADFLGIIIKKYSNQYPDLSQRVAEYLTNIVFDGRNHSISQYGAILGLQRIDLSIVRSTLIPSIDIFFTKIKNDMKSKIPSASMLAINLKNALLNLCGMCYKHDKAQNMNKEEIQNIYSKVMIYYGNDFITFAS
ncbi:hypothetical protein M9Y10_039209 [Tritrichomonas musculus]|uniref:TAF6 C-terminal HEAT repeat domain-containing protein n=1 Tax=Tritrichomonas musculus TaxID=1915356 RepID=A0ABR2GL62_9EUKA